MYTGMFAIPCTYQTIILPYSTFIFWLIFGYLIYKYFNLKAEFRKYEKPYGHEREKVESEDVPYYYKVLGVSKDAPQEEIKRAYYRLVRIYHPDVSADPEARRKFEEIRKAYEVYYLTLKSERNMTNLSMLTAAEDTNFSNAQ